VQLRRRQRDIRDKAGRSVNNSEEKQLVGAKTKKDRKELLESKYIRTDILARRITEIDII
jgi:hypothetical protein